MARWTFGSIDPATGEEPDDPFVGFLPPNIVPPEGEGSVSLEVLPADLASGSLVTNRARIVFDAQPPLDTPLWINTLDGDAPSSQVAVLPTSQAGPRFEVRWSGADATSGLLGYTIYVADTGGDFLPWIANTSALRDTFTGVPGHQYAFYSMALDSAGNFEEWPEHPDAITFMTGAAGVDDGAPRLALEGVRPNPAVQGFRIAFTLPDRLPATLEVIDVTGRKAFSRAIGAMGPGRHVLDLTRERGIPTGIYFIRLTHGVETRVVKAVRLSRP